MRTICGIGLVLLAAVVCVGCKSVDMEILKPDSCKEAARDSITVVVRNNSNYPLGLLSITLAVGEVRMQKTFTTFPQVTYNQEKGEAVAVFSEGVEDVGPAAITPRTYREWHGADSAVLLERMLMPGDKMEVTIPFIPYPHLGEDVHATAELIRIDDVYKQQRRMVATQNVVREITAAGKKPFIETTTTTVYEYMKYPLGSGSYLVTMKDYDSNPRRDFNAEARLDIKPLEFTFTEAAAKVDFKPQKYIYYHPGKVWLFYHGGETWFVSPDVVEHYPGGYKYMAVAVMDGREMIAVEIHDEITEGACPLLSLLFEAGYTVSKTTVHAPGHGRNVWHLSKDRSALLGYIRIKYRDLLQFARDLDAWGYYARGDLLEKK